MGVDMFDLKRVRDYLDRYPESQIILIANKAETSKIYWERIKGHLDTKLTPRIVTNHPYSLDGIPIVDALVLKIGKWWENKNSIYFIENYSKLAKNIIPVTYIP